MSQQPQTTQRAEMVRDYCRKHRDLPSLTLAKLIYKHHPLLFVSVEGARDAVRMQRGNKGDTKNRARKTAFNADTLKPNTPAGFVWNFPKSHSPSYDPVRLDARRTLILSDLHIPFHDTPAINACMRVGEHIRPDCILLNGDVCDFHSLSRFDKNPTESSLKLEIELTRQFLGWLREKFPKARIVYKLGNHDEWFEKYICRKAPELLGVAGITLQTLVTAKTATEPEIGGIEFLDDQQKIKIGHLNVWHGHEIGKGSIAPPVNPARGLFMRTLDCGLMGHLHKGSMHEETTSNGKLVATWSTGCLCGLHPRYARVNKWGHGAAWVQLAKDDDYTVNQIRILNGKIL